MDLEKILKAMSLVDELVTKLNSLEDETLELSVIGTTIDSYFISKGRSVKEGWNELNKGSEFAHTLMGDE